MTRPLLKCKSPPESEQELLDNAWSIAGMTLRQLALLVGESLPENLQRKKGFVGSLLEKALGATAGSLPEPDFQHINVELKSIPILHQSKPAESTHICVVNPESHWQSSLVKKKLTRVLWIPVQADPDQALADRKIGSPLLWSPSEPEEMLLKNDWEELMELVNMGEYGNINAHLGDALQIRPKAANSYSLETSQNSEGKTIKTLPRGFYLRTSFTQCILKNHFA